MECLFVVQSMRAVETGIIWILAILAGCVLAKFGDFEAVYATREHAEAGWSYWLNLSANSFHPWRVDHALGSLLAWLPFELNHLNEGIFYSVVFSVAAAAYFSALEGETFSVRSLGAGLLLGLLTLLLVGCDTLVLSTLCYLCFFLWSLEKSVDVADNSIFNWVTVAVTGAMLAQAVPYVSPILLGLSFVFYFNKINPLFFVVPVFLSVGMLLLAPAPDFPVYPLLARVVPDDGIEGMLRPLVGEDAPLPIINREFVRSVYPLPSLILAFLAVATLCLSSLTEHHSTAKRFSLIAALIGIALVWDASFAEKFSIIGPLATIKRVVPGGLFFVFLNSTWFLLSFLFMFVAAVLIRRVMLFATIALVVVLAPVLSSKFLPGNPAAVLQELNRTSQLELAEDAELAKFVVSPSYYVLRRGGPEVLIQRDFRNRLVSQPLGEDVKITSFPSADSLAIEAMRDGSLKTRWSARPGKQVGDEWISVQFLRPVDIAGVEVATGVFPWDFPRGLAVLVADTCEADSSELTSYRELFRDDDWQGAIRYTKDGFPFFSGQGDVRVYFAETLKTSCLLIRQIGISEHYDWSVAEIKLLIDTAHELALDVESTQG